jgi:hypothetical protein
LVPFGWTGLEVSMLPSLRPARRRPVAVAIRAGLGLALALACGACDTHSRRFFPNQPPTLTLTSGPVDTLSAPQSWLVDIAWTATDPDGVIDHFEYAVDPPTLKQATLAQAETTWVTTRETHVVAHFHAAHPDSLGPGATASEFHVFALRAVDNRGGRSPNVVRAFYAYTVAPDVRITSPAPSRFFTAPTGAPFRLSWQGDDPDGGSTRVPASYRVRFLELTNGANIGYLLDPDSLLNEGARTDWQGWRSVDGAPTSLDVSGFEFVPNTRWLVVVLAVDEAGATTAYVNFDRNALIFDIVANASPRIHLFSQWIEYTTPAGGYDLDPARALRLDVPSNIQFTLHWDGLPAPGRQLLSSRWMLDGNVGDETPRTDEATDWIHWSQPQAGTGTATFGPLDPGVHTLYIEVTDDYGYKSLLVVRLSVIQEDLRHDLLVVDDTRLEVDKFIGDPFNKRIPDNYTQPWPSRTELDTFLFARGGYPWRGTKNPPTGVISAPGLLTGYAFDTLGTRLGLEDPSGAVPLSKLALYKHVLWLVDAKGAIDPGGVFPITALRWMSAPGHLSALVSYVAMGGKVWLAGGGAAYASLIEFNSRITDGSCGTVFSASSGELRPSSLLYAAGHVRSALTASVSNAEPSRSPAARGGWSGHGPAGDLTAPDYSRLPATLRFRTLATDPLPPTRPAQTTLYYGTNASNEYISAPNEIAEDFDPSDTGVRLESALDSLYEVSSIQLCVSPAPAMVYYHGRETAPFVFTGFDLWSWSRADCQGLVDFVLGDIWKLSKSAPSASVRAAAGAPPLPSRVSSSRSPRLSGVHPVRR